MIVAKLSSSLPEGLRRCGYKALQNPALLSFLSKNTQLLLYTLFSLHLRLLLKANHRAEQGSETILFQLKSVGSRSSRLCRAPYESLADEMSAGSPLKKQITYLGTANGILFPLLLSSSQEL